MKPIIQEIYQVAKNYARNNWPVILLGLVLFVVLYFISLSNYLFFHTLAEVFSTVIAFTIFVLIWNARRNLDNGYLVFLGIGFMFVGWVGVVHMLAFRGMGVFPETGESANMATQLWLSSRYLYAVSLILAPFFLRRAGWSRYILAGYFVVAALLMASIFWWRIFPAAFIEGRQPMPLTPFKIASEYTVMLLIAIGGLLLLRIRKAFDLDMLVFLFLSILFQIPAGFFFTQYLSPFDLRNLFGHYFQIISFYLMYKAVVETAFLRPQEVLYRNLRASEERERARSAQLEAIMDAVPAIVWITNDPNAQHVQSNRLGLEILRLQPENNPSLSAPEGEAPSNFKVIKGGRELTPEELPLQISARTGKHVRGFEETVRFDDGEERHLLGNVTPLLDDYGKPNGAVAAFIDVTEQVHAQQAMLDSERRYRELFDKMAEGFALNELIYDANGTPVDYRIQRVNPAFELLTGLRADQVEGKTIRELVPNVDPLWIERYAEADKTGGSVRFEDYSTLLDRYYEVLVYSTGKSHVASLSVDVTERYKGQEALRISEARLRRLVDSNIIGVMYTDERGTIALTNDAFLEMIGYTRADFEAGLVDWAKLTPPEHLLMDQKGIEEALDRGACTPYEKEYFRKDRSRVPVLIGYAYLKDAPAPFVCFVVDLTEQKQAEASARQYAEELERTNRELGRANSELQDFAFVASHDLQEPLRKIQAFGERLNKMAGASLADEGRDYLNRMLSAAGRMRTMINDLLMLSRITTQGRPFETVKLTDLALEVRDDLEVRLENSEGEVHIDELPQVEGDRTQMRQLLLNLIGNAVKFHRPGVPPRVHVSTTRDDGRVVQIFIRDNGVGFEEQYLERIFQPFQRLHGMGQYEGSGIGLAICRKIVDRHGGMITAQSTPGEGSTFIVTLPTCQPVYREEV